MVAKTVNERKMFGRVSRTVAWTACALSVAVLATASVLRVTGKHENEKHEKKPRVWCTSYDPLNEKLMTYVEGKGKATKGSELGASLALSPSSYFGNKKPLAYFCRGDGTIWLVDDASIYTGKINITDAQLLTISSILKFQYTTLPEFQGEGVTTIAASVWWPVNETRPYVAVVTNTGFFEAFQPPLQEPTITDKSVIDLRSEYASDDRANWPGIVEKAVVGVLSAVEFSVIPLASSTSQRITVFYHIRFKDLPPYDGQGGIEMRFIDVKDVTPDLMTITDATSILYDTERGGWVTSMKGITEDGQLLRLDRNVRPREVSNILGK